MSNVAKTIHLPDDIELARLLHDADGTDFFWSNMGSRTEVTRENKDPVAVYDPNPTRAGMNAGAGALTPEQAEEIKTYIYRGCEEGSRPVERPRYIYSIPTKVT